MAGHDLVFPDIEVGDSGKNHMANIKGLAGAGVWRDRRLCTADG